MRQLKNREGREVFDNPKLDNPRLDNPRLMCIKHMCNVLYISETVGR